MAKKYGMTFYGNEKKKENVFVVKVYQRVSLFVCCIFSDLSKDGTLEWKDFDLARQVTSVVLIHLV